MNGKQVLLIIIEIGNPRNHMELINPSCSAERPEIPDQVVAIFLLL
jgi:hypothetical protein